VRGTAELANLRDDLLLAADREPELAEFVKELMVHIVHAAPALAEEVLQWMDNVHCQLDVALNLYVTGHSLGAAAVSIAYGWYFLEQVILRFQPPVIFESPGVPNRC